MCQCWSRGVEDNGTGDEDADLIREKADLALNGLDWVGCVSSAATLLLILHFCQLLQAGRTFSLGCTQQIIPSIQSLLSTD